MKMKTNEKKNEIVQESKHLDTVSFLWPVIAKHRYFYLVEKSAAHLDVIVGPLVICQTALKDVRYIADDAQIGKIILS